MLSEEDLDPIEKNLVALDDLVLEAEEAFAADDFLKDPGRFQDVLQGLAFLALRVRRDIRRAHRTI